MQCYQVKDSKLKILLKIFLESKTKEINISSRKNSAKKERKEKIKFGKMFYKGKKNLTI